MVQHTRANLPGYSNPTQVPGQPKPQPQPPGAPPLPGPAEPPPTDPVPPVPHPPAEPPGTIRGMGPLIVLVALCVVLAGNVPAQEMPADYKAVLSALGKTGDFKDGVLKVNIPRNDVTVLIGGRPAPTAFGFGGWVALTKGDGGADVMMGDLVLREDEVNPVMSAVLDNGLDVTALHNHFFWEQPRMFYMHVHGMGAAADLARRIKPAIDRIAAFARPAPLETTPTIPVPDPLDTAALAKIIGQAGETSGGVYKITIGRPDLDMREHGARIGTRMGLNTWAAFFGSDKDAMVAGDIVMLEHEVTPVLRALRGNGLNVVAMHHHMTGVTPVLIFLHYYGTGPAATLAQGVRAAVVLLSKPTGS